MKTLDYALWALAGVAVGALVLTKTGVIGSPLGSLVIGDLRGQASPSDKAAPYVKSRDPADVDTAVLHQMAFTRGTDPTRYLRTTAHYIVLADGSVWQLYGWGVNLPAANGYNKRAVSIEFAGNFPSRSMSTDPDRWWYPSGRDHDPAYQQHLTPAAAAAGRKLMAYLQAQGVQRVQAHKQSAGDRGNDPGPDIWGAVGEYAIRDLGMGHDVGTIGSGQPIPEHWRDAYAIWNGSALAA